MIQRRDQAGVAAVILAVALAGAAIQPSSGQSAGGDGEKLIRGSDCSSCHAVDHNVVGPGYNAIARRYAGQADASDKIAAKIRDGGGGMTPHPDLTEAERREIAAWILAQKEPAAAQGQAEAKQYTYTLKDGAKIQ